MIKFGDGVAACLIFLSLIVFAEEGACQDDYSYLGQACEVVNELGDTLNSGNLLQEDVLTEEQIEVFTFRYDSDTVITNRFGDQIDVERLFDIYLPAENLSFFNNGSEITNLPVMMVLHTGQGDKESTAGNAYEWARRGYAVIVPSYRTDRLGVNYCYIYTKSLYLAAQDISATIRVFSLLYDDAVLPESNIPDNPLVGKPIDGEQIFFTGFSYGGSAGFHLATRMVQEQWEPFLGGSEGYVIDGEEGSLEIGDAGPLHGTGRDAIQDYPFPFDRIKGAVCRTAGTFGEDQLNFELSPVKVPVAIICGTCDIIIPYTTRTFVNNDGLCDARVDFPNGSSDTTFTFYGPDFISNKMSEAEIYHEIITFCNGGHNTNPCVFSEIRGAEIEFMTRILTGDFSHDETYEKVYRYPFENYANQCCEIGDDYAYIQKCSCDEDNPYDVIDLEYTEIPVCQFWNQCDLDSICNLEPLSVNLFDNALLTPEVSLVSRDGILNLKLTAETAHEVEISIYLVEGKLLHGGSYRLMQGVNYIPLHSGIPSGNYVIIHVEGYAPLKLFVR